MNALPPLYVASVPVFRRHLDLTRRLLDRVAGREAVLAARLAPDMFTCGQQIATASGFALRTAFPLAGLPLPALDEPPPDRAGLARRIDDTQTALASLDPAAFVDAAARRIRHRAGFADLEQDGADYLHLFGMPNFLFHTTMAFAILRAQGLDIGKADFDGLHDYPPGFRF
jgi:hypothetical protein